MALIQSKLHVLVHPGTEAVFDDEAVHDDVDVMALILLEGLHVGEEFHLPIDAHADETLFLQAVEDVLLGAFFMTDDRGKNLHLAPRLVMEDGVRHRGWAERGDRAMAIRAIGDADPRV